MDHRLFLNLTFVVLSLVPFAQGQNYSGARKAAAMAVSAHQYDRALKLLEPLIRAHSDDPTLWTLRGLSLSDPSQTRESLTSFDRALSLDKNFLPALKGASQVAYLSGDMRASQYVQQLLSVAPADEIAHAMAGALAYQAQDCPASVVHFRKSGQEVYRNIKALAEYADCLVRQDQLPETTKVLKHALELHPDSTQIKYNMAYVELRNHNPAETIRILEPLSEVKDSQLLNLLGSAYAKVNRPDDAFKTLTNAIALSPTDQSNYLDLAVLCLEHNNEERSVAAATEGIARIPRATSLFLIRGVAYAQMAEYDKAETDFTTAAQIDPNKPHSTIAMSLLYSDRNQLDKEKELLQQQLKTTPNDAVANYLMADILIREGAEPGQPQFTEAKAALGRSLASQRDSAEAQILMGTLLQQETEYSQALEHFVLALNVEPDSHSALNHELLLLRKLHRNSESTEVMNHLKTLLDNDVQRERPATSVRVDPSNAEPSSHDSTR